MLKLVKNTEFLIIQIQSLELVEVQIGKTLSEKDIVRIDDIYGRAKKEN